MTRGLELLIAQTILQGFDAQYGRFLEVTSGAQQRFEQADWHAVQQAMPGIPQAVDVLVLYGDVPLTRPETLRRLLAAQGLLRVLVAEPGDPAGYGRIVRDVQGRVAAIVEHRDADEEQHPPSGHPAGGERRRDVECSPEDEVEAHHRGHTDECVIGAHERHHPDDDEQYRQQPAQNSPAA